MAGNIAILSKACGIMALLFMCLYALFCKNCNKQQEVSLHAAGHNNTQFRSANPPQLHAMCKLFASMQSLMTRTSISPAK